LECWIVNQSIPIAYIPFTFCGKKPVQEVNKKNNADKMVNILQQILHLRGNRKERFYHQRNNNVKRKKENNNVDRMKGLFLFLRQWHVAAVFSKLQKKIWIDEYLTDKVSLAIK
jgi:hypothetical protein